AGRAASAVEYVAARRAVDRLAFALRRLLGPLDLLALPGRGQTAPKIDVSGRLLEPLHPRNYTAPLNPAGVPALTVPCGFDPEGLPIGLQLVGRHWAEARSWPSRTPTSRRPTGIAGGRRSRGDARGRPTGRRRRAGVRRLPRGVAGSGGPDRRPGRERCLPPRRSVLPRLDRARPAGARDRALRAGRPGARPARGGGERDRARGGPPLRGAQGELRAPRQPASARPLARDPAPPDGSGAARGAVRGPARTAGAPGRRAGPTDRRHPARTRAMTPRGRPWPAGPLGRSRGAPAPGGPRPG